MKTIFLELIMYIFMSLLASMAAPTEFELALFLALITLFIPTAFKRIEQMKKM